MIFIARAPQRVLHYRVTRHYFAMAEKQKHSSACDFHSCSSKLACPSSLVSLLICTAALVRVELINQQVHDVEDSVADVQQIQNLIKVSTGEETVQRPSSRVDSVRKFDTKMRRDEAEGKVFLVFSSCRNKGLRKCSFHYMMSICFRVIELNVLKPFLLSELGISFRPGSFFFYCI